VGLVTKKKLYATLNCIGFILSNKIGKYMPGTKIPVVHDLSGVGKNLNDHPDIVMQFKCKKPVLEFQSKDSFKEKYTEFYNKLLN
jgi:choline dehydrogenase-like flavoprotein